MNVREMSSEQLQKNEMLVNNSINSIIDLRFNLSELGITISEYQNASRVQLDKLYEVGTKINVEIKRRLEDSRKQLKMPFMFESELEDCRYED